MKPLFKLTLFIAFCACTTAAFSQISIGVKAGLNLSTVLTDNEDADPKIIPSFQVGGVVEIGITEQLAVQTGISLQGKGFKFEDSFLGETVRTTARPLYLQVPAHLLYRGSGFFVGVGPYVGYGIAGKYTFEVAGESDSDDIIFGDTEEDDWSALDFGVGLQAGVNVGSIRVGAGYDLGLTSITPKDQRSDNDPTAMNGVINVFAAYMFGN